MLIADVFSINIPYLHGTGASGAGPPDELKGKRIKLISLVGGWGTYYFYCLTDIKKNTLTCCQVCFAVDS